MIDQKPSSIEEAPSLSDITSADDRVGKVDFTSRLGERDRDDATSAEATPARDGKPSLASMVRPQRPTDQAPTADEDGPRMPFILPPAKVDAAMTAEAERTRLEIATARGELPEDEPAEDEPAESEDVEPDTEALETPADADETSTDAEPDVRDEDGEDDEEDDAAVTPARTPGPPEGLVIREVADLATVAAEVAQREAEEASRADAEHVARLRTESEAAARAADEALARAATIDATELDDDTHDDAADDTAGDTDVPVDLPVAPVAMAEPTVAEPVVAPAPIEDAPLRSVDEVASSVITAMRRINEAHEHHVEALEIEAARRCELLTAQAELDAELIRLHARREAHAIISAARARSGQHDAEVVEIDQLGEIGETFSRFAETIETTVAASPASPDHLRKS